MTMKINSFTNYSFRLLIMLGANPDRTIPLSEIASAYDISVNHLKKVSARLMEHGLISSARGRSGGIKLLVPPETVYLGEIFRISQTETAFVECLEKGEQGCAISPVCRLKGIFESALSQFIKVMDEYTLADLIENRDEINHHLKLVSVD